VTAAPYPRGTAPVAIILDDVLYDQVALHLLRFLCDILHVFDILNYFLCELVYGIYI
jgi:hypothetical protein